MANKAGRGQKDVSLALLGMADVHRCAEDEIVNLANELNN